MSIMTYAFIQDVPANVENLRQDPGRARGRTAGWARRSPGAAPAAGPALHRCRGGRGRRWTLFRQVCVEPAVSRVLASYGISHDHSQVHVEEIDVIDTWLGAVTAAGSSPAAR